MIYDIIFILGEEFFDHPLCGVAILKRLLEKNNYKVGVIDKVTNKNQVTKLGKPNLFFGVSSGSMDSMVRNYTPLKKLRIDDENLDYDESVPDRAVLVYSNWIKEKFKGSFIVIGGIESTLRRFVHYDYWQNRLRKPILFEAKADILVYGSAEKQIVEIADKIKNKESVMAIPGTCIIGKKLPKEFKELPSFESVSNSKEEFCNMQNLLTNNKDLAQKIDTRYLLQYKSPKYTSFDLDEYYELGYSRDVPKELRGFQFSIVTHRGCFGKCSFCALNLIQGNSIISRSEESILREIKNITKLSFFKGDIDDLGGPSANMYGMDCDKCKLANCLNCDKLDRSNKRLINLLKTVREIEGVGRVFVKSGIRYDLASKEYLKDVAKYHIFDTLRIAPEHVNKNILKLMNKDHGNLKEFIKNFDKLNSGKSLAYYFMTAHPGSSIKEAKELADAIGGLRNAESIQVFTPTPMTVSTCMYYTGINPKTKKPVHVPYTYSEKKQQKRFVLDD